MIPETERVKIPSETPVSADDEWHLRKWVAVLLRSWVLILAGGIAGALFGTWVASRSAPVYEGSATVLFRTEGRNVTLAEIRALIVNRTVASQVVADLGAGVAPDELMGASSVTPVPNTQLVHVNVLLKDPGLAARAATRTSEVAVEHATTLWRQASADRRSQLEVATEQARRELADALKNPQTMKPGETRVGLDTELEMRRRVYVDFASRLAIARIEHDALGGPLRLMDPSTVPGQPLPSHRSRTVALGLLAGLVAAASVVILRQWVGAPATRARTA